MSSEINDRSSLERLQVPQIIFPPLIELMEDGETFKLDQWKTPLGGPPKSPLIDPEYFREKFARRYAKERGLELVDLIIEDGVLQRISLKDSQIFGRVNLNGISAAGQAEYQFDDVTSGKMAIALQALLARYINSLRDPKQQIPYIDGQLMGYYPVDLKISRYFLSQKVPLTDEKYQRQFIEQARNMSARYGLVLRNDTENMFNNRLHTGVLEYVGTDPLGGDSADYTLDDSTGVYGEHNVDLSNQALLLHWITGSFIRDLAGKVNTI